ncbi:MAG: AAA family ATPase [Paracoccaceae bacterium]
MPRVMVIGQPGSGKSTFARLLGDATGLPVVHIDRIHFRPGWVERSRAEKTALCAKVHAQDGRILKGGFSATWPERMARADTMVWMDLPLWLRAPRIARRTQKNYGRTRPDMPENCPGSFAPRFLPLDLAHPQIWSKTLRKRIQNCATTY